jgi:hypothetical protein
VNVIDLDAHRPPRNPGNGALELVRDYLDRIHPARMCARSLVGKAESDAALPDGDYFLAWLAAEGFVIVPLESAGA